MARPVWRPFFLQEVLIDGRSPVEGNSHSTSIHGNGPQHRGSWAKLTAEIVPQHTAALCREAAKVPKAAQPCFMALHPTMAAPAPVQNHLDTALPVQCPSHHDCRTSVTVTHGQELPTAVDCYSSQHFRNEHTIMLKRKQESTLKFYIYRLLHWQREKPKFDWFDQTKQFKHLLPNLRPKKNAAMQKQLINQKQKNRN